MSHDALEIRDTHSPAQSAAAPSPHPRHEAAQKALPDLIPQPRAGCEREGRLRVSAAADRAHPRDRRGQCRVLGRA